MLAFSNDYYELIFRATQSVELFCAYDLSAYISTKCVIIPGLFEPPVRTLRATIPENESHIFR